MRCRKCRCTDHDCTGCVERTGRPCRWVEIDLCSACTPRFTLGSLVVAERPTGLPWPKGWMYVIQWPGGDPEEHVGRAYQNVENLVELHVPPGLFAIARRLLPRLAKQGLIRPPT